MNKGQLIDAISDKCEGRVSKRQIEEVLSTMTDVITDTVASGEKVTLVGFCTLEKTHRQARTGRNPKTGEQLEIPASYRVKVSIGKNFSDRVAAS